MPIDYHKWDHIEVSDDEDDTHPNIDTPSLFRWRHQARVERMEKMEKEDEVFQFEWKEWEVEYKKVERELSAAKSTDKADAIPGLEKKLNDLKQRKKELDKKKDELEKEKRKQPMNVDTLSQPGFTSSRVNKANLDHEDRTKDMSEEEKVDYQIQFSKKWATQIKEFGMMKKSSDSLSFLVKHPDLVCEETANYLTIYCIDLAVEEKFALMEQISYQVISMQYILTLGKELKLDPRAAVRPFYDRLNKVNKEYMDVFNDELNSFRERIRKRAKERVEEAMREVEEEERQKRLGPGGLDPVEVYEELPDDLKECFNTKDIQMLKDTFEKYEPSEARMWLKKCVDSGLWVPDKNSGAEDGGEEGEKEVLESEYDTLDGAGDESEKAKQGESESGPKV